MPKFTHHVFVCCNQRPADHPRGCCNPDGSNHLKNLFKAELKQANVEGVVRANEAACLDQCELGPAVVIYPQAIWYGNVTPEDVPRIVSETIIGGRVLEDLQISDELLTPREVAFCPEFVRCGSECGPAMRIVVLGGGTVGTWIADLLCRHRHSVTVVDNDPSHTKRINDELDVRVVTGSASQSSVLFQADCIGADVCLAVTGEDEVNLVAASMAKAMGARRAIARVYAPVFRDVSTFDYQRHFGIDRLLSLEHLSAMELARGIRHPGSVVLEHFARGGIEVQEVEVNEKTAAVGVPLRQLALPRSVRIGSLYRDGRLWIAGADDAIEIGDRVTLIGRREDVDEVKESIQRDGGRKQGIVIAGGGENGLPSGADARVRQVFRRIDGAVAVAM